ncbi:MAG: DUF2231 domain-containing protein [Aquificaceae bacterium]|nr:DUF2231 domain-containing protein [Aquificaceae bacterium]MDW8066578.1 DUF2231 domain-containing protein [Aquificaceae bacterium]MDW8423156.1 DUF2231 domain-containing protein [Aquificaceae bacterium]
MELIKIHPPVVHFAIALPFALLVLEIYYRFNRKNPDGLHFIFTLLSSLSVLGAVLSGMVAYEPIEDKLYKIKIFSYHKYTGLFLAVLFIVLFVIRLNIGKSNGMRNLFTLILLLGMILLFIQGSMGGSIVYDHMVKPWVEMP